MSRLQAIFVTFCNLLILLMFTACHDYTSPVGTPDVVLSRLKAANIRPVTLAKALGLDRSSASLILNGKRGIPRKHFEAIAKLLGIELPELVAGLSYKNKSLRMTSPVIEDQRQYGATPVGEPSTGTSLDADSIAYRVAPSDQAEFQRIQRDVATEVGRADEIIRHANWIIQLADGLRGLDRQTPGHGGDTSGGDSGDSSVREHGARAHGRKRRSSGGGC